MSIAADIAPSHSEIVASLPHEDSGRRPLLAMILIGASVLATFAWVAAMVWLAKTLFGISL
jgi:hypothetical protein